MFMRYRESPRREKQSVQLPQTSQEDRLKQSSTQDRLRTMSCRVFQKQDSLVCVVLHLSACAL